MGHLFYPRVGDELRRALWAVTIEKSALPVWRTIGGAAKRGRLRRARLSRRRCRRRHVLALSLHRTIKYKLDKSLTHLPRPNRCKATMGPAWCESGLIFMYWWLLESENWPCIKLRQQKRFRDLHLNVLVCLLLFGYTNYIESRKMSEAFFKFNNILV